MKKIDVIVGSAVGSLITAISLGFALGTVAAPKNDHTAFNHTLAGFALVCLVWALICCALMIGIGLERDYG